MDVRIETNVGRFFMPKDAAQNAKVLIRVVIRRPSEDHQGALRNDHSH